MKLLKKVILAIFILFLSINLTSAAEITDNCKNTVNKSNYPLLNDRLSTVLLNLGDKLHKKVIDKTNEYQINYFGRLISVLNTIISKTGLTDKQKQIIEILFDNFNCKETYLINRYSWEVGDYGECNCATKMATRRVICVDGNNQIYDDSFCTDNKPETSKSCTCEEAHTKPNIETYTFINGTTINKNEIIRYFNDYEAYRNGIEIIDFTNYAKNEHIFQGETLDKAKTWYKQNIYDLQYFPRIVQFHGVTVKDYLYIPYNSESQNIYERIIGLQIASKIVDGLMPSSYIDYPDTDYKYLKNKDYISVQGEKMISLLSSKIGFHGEKITSGETNIERKRILTIFSEAYRSILNVSFGSCFFPVDGRYMKYIQNGSAFAWGPAQGKVFSEAPTEDQLCWGLFASSGTKKLLSYSSDDIKYGKYDRDYGGHLFYSCFTKSFNQSCDPYAAGGTAYWEKTRVFRIYTGNYTNNSIRLDNRDRYITTLEEVKNLCKHKGYNNGKILNKKDGYVEYIKCWNGKEAHSNIEDISAGDTISSRLGSLMNDKGHLESIRSGDFSITNLSSNYYWKIIEKVYADGRPTTFCNELNLNTEIKIGTTKYKCSKKENQGVR